MAANWPRGVDQPVFSVAWVRRRMLRFAILALVIAVPTLFAAMSETGDWRAIVIAAIVIPLPFLTYPAIGPSLAVWVHARSLRRRMEAAALAAAILLGIGISFAIDQGINSGLRVLFYGDAKSRYSLVTAVEISVHKSDDAEPGKKTGSDDARQHRPQYDGLIKAADVFTIGLLMFWLGAGFELIRFFRQRRAIEEAMRQQALEHALAARNEAELKLSVLAAQIEPHFLFNTLAGVRSAITSDPERAVTIVDHLADYLRASIPRLRGDGMTADSTVATQIAFVRAYLGLMHARMPRLDFTIDCAPDLDALPMPPMLLIPLVENAVKHGIEPKIGPGRVIVHIARETVDERDELVATVEDNGVGFGNARSGTGIGLVNIRERLATLYGDAAALSLSARPDGGVIARIRLPLQPEGS